MTESMRIAREKYRRAIKAVEESEQLLANAAELMSGLVYAVHEWELIGKQFDQVRQLRREVSYSTAKDRVDMDSDWKDSNPEPKGKTPNAHMEVQK